jgi:uncharacterized membrane protein
MRDTLKPDAENNKKPMRKISTRIIQVAALIGLLDSIYLAYVKIASAPIYCTPGLGDCEVVNASRWSELFGIPLGVYGMAGFGLILLVTTYGMRINWVASYTDLILFGISTTGFFFSLYLTGIEIFVLKTVCQWCLLSAIAITVIFVTTIIRLVVKSPSYIRTGGN